jgi:hypothetical protein
VAAASAAAAVKLNYRQGNYGSVGREMVEGELAVAAVQEDLLNDQVGAQPNT